jgi:hypothetical protein
VVSALVIEYPLTPLLDDDAELTPLPEDPADEAHALPPHDAAGTTGAAAAWIFYN